MEKTFLAVLVIEFIAVISFLIANTALGIMYPVFSQTASTMSFINQTSFEQQADVFKNAASISLFIIVAIPVAYLFLKIFRKEPEPYPYQGGYYDGI